MTGGHRRILARGQLVARVDGLRSSDRIELDDGNVWSVASEPEILRVRSAAAIVTCAVERVVAAPAPSSVIA